MIIYFYSVRVLVNKLTFCVCSIACSFTCVSACEKSANDSSRVTLALVKVATFTGSSKEKKNKEERKK